jgi:uncharacterized membrane protein YjgN (DUF898 family)
MSATTQPALKPILVYDGKIGDLYKIFLVNLLLTIVTLGIFRFWGITRMRRYIWSRTSSMGSRFEYDGTGGQLFVGFLLALLVIFGLIAVGVGATVALKGSALRLLPIVIMYVLVLVLALGAPFSAQRYRLGHTVWRGIRGGMTGSMLTYGAISLVYFLLMVITLYQLAPWVALRLNERLINASSFGDQRFSAKGRAGVLYLRFLMVFVGVAVLAVVVFGIDFVFLKPVIAQLSHAHGQPPDPRVTRQMTLILLPAYLVLGFGGALISAGYTALFFRHLTSHTTMGGLRFGSEVTAMTVLKLILGNALILIFTLGFGIPIVTHRNVRYFTQNLLASGTIDLAALGQNQQPVSRFGEGMFQALDAGAGIG